MKSFNLKAALAGAAVITRSGKPAYDLHYLEHADPENERLVGVVDGYFRRWWDNGRYFGDTDEVESDYDLFMAPVIKTYWFSSKPCDDGSNEHWTTMLYPTKEAAEAARPNTHWTLRSIDIEE